MPLILPGSPRWRDMRDPRDRFKILTECLLDEQRKTLPDLEKLEAWAETREAYRAACVKLLPESVGRNWDSTHNISVTMDALGKAKRYKRKAIQRMIAEFIDARRHRQIWAVIWKYRQGGVSTEIASQIYLGCARDHGSRAIIVAQADPEAAVIFEEKYVYMHKHDPLAPVAGRANTGELFFPDLNSHIRVRSAGGRRGVSRGGNNRYCHLSESAWYPGNPYVLIGGILQGVTHPQAMVFMESTANGQAGMFYETALEALNAETARREGRQPEKETKWEPIFLAWYLEDEAKRGVPFDSDEAKERFVRSMRDDEKLIQQQAGLTPEQMHWYRDIFDSKIKGETMDAKLMLLQQEYPSCVTAETRVSTNLGIIQIKDAATAKMSESGAIVGFGRREPSEIFRLETECGWSLRATGDHPVATPGGFARMDSLVAGGAVTLRAPMFADDYHVVEWHPFKGMTSSVRVDERWGKFLGYFMGDGCWTVNSLDFACDARDKDVLRDVRSVLTELVGVPNERVIVRKQGSKGCVNFRIGCKPMREAMELMGCIGSPDKDHSPRRIVQVPDAIWRSPAGVVKEFLSALFESDGSCASGHVSFASSKEQFARDVQRLLLGFGITSRLSVQEYSRQGGKNYCWCVSLRQAESKAFLERIGFVGARKNAGMDSVRRGKHASVYPNGQPRLGRQAAVIVFEDVVKSVVPDGFEETFDLSIAGEHVFSANGILVHNSPLDAFVAPGSSAFDMPTLVSLTLKCKEPIWQGDVQVPGSRPGIKPLFDFQAGEAIQYTPMPQRIKRADGPLRVWKWPVVGRRYVWAWDLAVSGAAKSDSTEAYCLDRDTEECVAHYIIKQDPNDSVVPCRLLSRLYNDALICPETNTFGGMVHSLLQTDRKPFLFWRMASSESSITEEMSREYGHQTNNKSKRDLVYLMREKLGTRPAAFVDKHLLDQLKTFKQIQTPRGEWRFPGAVPGSGTHDDGAMAMMIAFKANRDAPLLGPDPDAMPNDGPIKPMSIRQMMDGHRQYEQERSVNDDLSGL